MLLKEASTGGLADWKRFVVIIFDELKVRESLVYDKHSSQVIGFVHLGEVDNHVNKLENENCRPEIATHVIPYGSWYFHWYTHPVCKFLNLRSDRKVFVLYSLGSN